MISKKHFSLGILAFAAAVSVFAFQQCTPLQSNDASSNGGLVIDPPPPDPSLGTDDYISASQPSIAQIFNGALDDRFYFTVGAKDGGYLTGGVTKSYGNGVDYDALVVKYNMLGTREWAYHVGSNPNNDQFFSGVQLIDGSFILAGLSRVPAPGALDQFLVVKLSNAGAFLWASRIGSANLNELAYRIAVTNDGNVVLAGRQNNTAVGTENAFYLKLNSLTGAVLWERTLGGTGTDFFHHVSVAANGDLLFAGTTASSGSGLTDAWIVRTDPNGAVLWSHALGGPMNEEGTSLVELANGRILLTGFTSSVGAGGSEALLSLFEANGNYVGSQIMGGPQGDVGSHLVRLSDNRILWSGNTVSLGTKDGFKDGFLLKLKADASSVEWGRTYGAAGDDNSLQVAEMADKRLAFSNFASLDGTPAAERATSGILKMNGSHTYSCAVSSATKTFTLTAATLSSLPAAATPVTVTYAPEALPASVWQVIAAPPITTCPAAI